MDINNDNTVIDNTAEPTIREYLGNEGRSYTFDDIEVECCYGDMPISKILAEVCKCIYRSQKALPQ